MPWCRSRVVAYVHTIVIESAMSNTVLDSNLEPVCEVLAQGQVPSVESNSLCRSDIAFVGFSASSAFVLL